MTSILFRWIINALTLILVAYLVPGFGVATFWSALVAALVLGFVNAVIRPFLFILTLPVTVLTLGLFTFVVNAMMILLVSSVVKGFEVSGLFSAISAAVVLWIVSLFTNRFIHDIEST